MRVRFKGWKRGLSRSRRPVTVVSAFLLFASLAFVTVTLTSAPKPAVPVQQTGTAAGRPHRVSAAADLGRVVDGRFVSDASAASKRLPGPVAEALSSQARVPGAVPPAATPKPLKLAAVGKTSPETASVRTPPTATPKTGFNPKTSRELPPRQADQVVYSNADGTRTAFEYQAPVNYRRPNGTWAPISANLVPAGPGVAAQPAPAAAQSSAASMPDTAAGVPADALFETPATSASASPSVTPSVLPTPTGKPVPSVSLSASASLSPSPSLAPAGGWTEKSESEP